MIRDDIKQALVGAMKGGDAAKRHTIRLIQSALKNRDIELRGNANPPEDDVLVTEDGNRNLTTKVPKDPDEIEALMQKSSRK